MLDTLFTSLSYVALQLLPILGAAALVFLCIMLKKVWVLLDETTAKVRALDPTLQKVDQSIEKLQAPLDTVARYCESLDELHVKSKSSINKMATVTNENANKAKAFVDDKLNKLQEIIKNFKAKAEDSAPVTEEPEDSEEIITLIEPVAEMKEEETVKEASEND